MIDRIPEYVFFDAVLRMYGSGDGFPADFAQGHLADHEHLDNCPTQRPFWGGEGYAALGHLYAERTEPAEFRETWLPCLDRPACWNALTACRAWATCKQDSTPSALLLLNGLAGDAGRLVSFLDGNPETLLTPQPWELLETELRHTRGTLSDATAPLEEAWETIAPGAPAVYREQFVESLVMAERCNDEFAAQFDQFLDLAFESPYDAVPAYRALYRLRDLVLLLALLSNTLETHIDAISVYNDDVCQG